MIKSHTKFKFLCSDHLRCCGNWILCSRLLSSSKSLFKLICLLITCLSPFSTKLQFCVQNKNCSEKKKKKLQTKERKKKIRVCSVIPPNTTSFKQTFTIRFIFCFDYDSRNILRTLYLAVTIFTTFASTTKTISTTMNTRLVTDNVTLTAIRICTTYTSGSYVTATATAIIDTTAAAAADTTIDRCIFTGIIGRNDYNRWQITVVHFRRWIVVRTTIVFRMWLMMVIRLEYMLETIEKMECSSRWADTTFRWRTTMVFVIVSGWQR